MLKTRGWDEVHSGFNLQEQFSCRCSHHTSTRTEILSINVYIPEEDQSRNASVILVLSLPVRQIKEMIHDGCLSAADLSIFSTELLAPCISSFLWIFESARFSCVYSHAELNNKKSTLHSWRPAWNCSTFIFFHKTNEQEESDCLEIENKWQDNPIGCKDKRWKAMYCPTSSCIIDVMPLYGRELSF